jgi:uncharacterized protein GlcG (DUF336 family)
MSPVRVLQTRPLYAVLALVALLSVAAARPVQAQRLPGQSYLPLDLALEAASAALAQCATDGYQVSVAVVDRGGVLKVLLRGDGTGPHTVMSSWRKAYTSASLGRPTGELALGAVANPALWALRDMDSQILILAGGLPIIVDDAVVGGIGVGGAPDGNLDEVCAQAGVDAVMAAVAQEGGEAATEEETAEEEATETPVAEEEVEATETPTAEEEATPTPQP